MAEYDYHDIRNSSKRIYTKFVSNSNRFGRETYYEEMDLSSDPKCEIEGKNKQKYHEKIDETLSVIFHFVRLRLMSVIAIAFIT